MQHPVQTRAEPTEDLSDAGDSANGMAGPQKRQRTKRVRPQVQGEGALSTTPCSPGKPSVARKKKTTPPSSKKPVPSAEGNAPPTVVAVPIRLKKRKKDKKNNLDYASAVRSEIPPRAASFDAVATEPSVSQKKRVKKALAAAREASAAEAEALEAERAAADKKQKQKAAKQEVRIARERDAKILKVRTAPHAHVHRRASPHAIP